MAIFRACGYPIMDTTPDSVVLAESGSRYSKKTKPGLILMLIATPVLKKKYSPSFSFLPAFAHSRSISSYSWGTTVIPELSTRELTAREWYHNYIHVFRTTNDSIPPRLQKNGRPKLHEKDSNQEKLKNDQLQNYWRPFLNKSTALQHAIKYTSIDRNRKYIKFWKRFTRSTLVIGLAAGIAHVMLYNYVSSLVMHSPKRLSS